MKYYKLVYYTTGEEYDYREKYLSEESFRKCRKAMIDGADYLFFEDSVIKTKMVKELLPTNDIEEYIQQGMSPTYFGLPEQPKLGSGEKNSLPSGKYEKMREGLLKKTEMPKEEEPPL